MRKIKQFSLIKYRNRVLKYAAILSIILTAMTALAVYITTKFDLFRMNEFILYFNSVISNKEITTIIIGIAFLYLGSILAIIAFDIIKMILYGIAVIIVGTYVIIWDTYQYLKDKDRYNSWNTY